MDSMLVFLMIKFEFIIKALFMISVRDQSNYLV